jgi:hypothetical protein
MRSHRNLHMLMGGVEHTDLMPHPGVMGLVGHNGHGVRPMPMGEGIAPHHAHIVALGYGLGAGLTAGGGSGGGGGDIGGSGLYATPHGGKLSKIGQAFNKAFNPQKNGVAQAVQKTIVAPIQHEIVNPIVKVGDQIKTGVVSTYNTAKTGFNKTFTPQTGNEIVSGLKTAGRYGIPALTGLAGGLAGGLATGGLGGQFAGSALGAYAGYKLDQALGIENSNDIPGVPSSKIKGTGMKRGRKPKGGELKKGAVKETLDKTWKAIPKGFHDPLEDLGRAGIEYAGYKLPPKKSSGKGVKGSKSKTHKGDMDYTTKKGDKYFHRGGHEETDSDTDSEDGSMGGTGMHKRRLRGKGMQKGSPQMKEKMARLRAMKGKGKVSGTGIHGNGQVDNNSPHSGAVRLSPYQNF